MVGRNHRGGHRAPQAARHLGCQGARAARLATVSVSRSASGHKRRPSRSGHSISSRLVPRLVEPDLLELGRLLDPVEIDMPEPDPRVGRRIGLDDREGRAGDVAVKAEPAQQAARERGLAGAERRRTGRRRRPAATRAPARRRTPRSPPHRPIGSFGDAGGAVIGALVGGARQADGDRRPLPLLATGAGRCRHAPRRTGGPAAGRGRSPPDRRRVLRRCAWKRSKTRAWSAGGDAAAIVGDDDPRRVALALGAEQHAPARLGVERARCAADCRPPGAAAAGRR